MLSECDLGVLADCPNILESATVKLAGRMVRVWRSGVAIGARVWVPAGCGKLRVWGAASASPPVCGCWIHNRRVDACGRVLHQASTSASVERCRAASLF